MRLGNAAELPGRTGESGAVPDPGRQGLAHLRTIWILARGTAEAIEPLRTGFGNPILCREGDAQTAKFHEPRGLSGEGGFRGAHFRRLGEGLEGPCVPATFRVAWAPDRAREPGEPPAEPVGAAGQPLDDSGFTTGERYG